AVFCGAVNGPIASIFLGLEFFGGGNILYFAIACAVSYMLSGRYSLYSSQKFVFSKLEPTKLQEINNSEH
ncbi:MAG: chloride channel protein, partial [Oscillospiraceae bacterium]